MRKPILIATARVDRSTYIPVSKILEDKGYPVVMYDTGKVISGKDAYIAKINETGILHITYNGIAIGPGDISAAWYRKVNHFELPYKEPQVAKRLYANSEVRTLHETIWSLYPEDIWLNSPEALMRAEHKLDQLLVAHRVGFLTPQTIVSSSWEDVAANLLPDDTSHMIIKMTRGVISEQNKLKAVYTHIVNRRKMKNLQAATYAFPAIYQSYIPKAREWRVTVVGDQVFSAAIYTNHIAKDDWRRLQATNAVRFKAEALPKDIADQCTEYLRELDLRYGAFDLIEQPDGKILFLECNSAGQYAWLEKELGLPISQAIACELIKIAQKNSSPIP